MKGGHPIIKKVIVKVEEADGRLRVVGETYLKRANGLVKKGRGRFESPDTIVLNRLPPSLNLEESVVVSNFDLDLSNVINAALNSSIKESVDTANNDFMGDMGDMGDMGECVVSAEAVPAAKTVGEMPAHGTVSLEYILGQIDYIMRSDAHIKNALDTVEKIPSIPRESNSPMDMVGSAKAEAVVEIVKCRETTMQSLLNLYTGLLNKLIG